MDLREATVLNVHPATHTVDLIIDNPDSVEHEIEDNVPLLAQLLDPLLRGGTVALPKVGTTVIVATVNGRVFVLGCLADYTERRDPKRGANEEAAARLAASLVATGHDTVGEEYGAKDPIYSLMGGASYAGGRPIEAMPGDWMQYGTDGNMLGVLEGGVTVLKASDTAQIQAYKSNDMVRIVARRFELLTDFGELKFTSDQGRAGFTIRGSNSTLNSDPKNENFNIHFALGDAGSSYMRLGNEHSYFELKGGNIYHKGELIKVRDVNAAAPVGSVVEAEQEARNISGASTTNIGGPKNETVKGDKKSVVRGGKQETIDGDSKCTVRSGQVNAQGTYEITATGWTNPIQDGPPIPFVTDAMVFKAINGNFKMQCGDSLVAGLVPGPQSALFKPSTIIENNNGDIKIRNTGMGAIEISAPLPPSATMTGGPTYGIVLNSPQVLIGGMPAVPHTPHPLPGPYPPSPMPIAKAPPIIAWINAVTSLLMTHTHPGPTGPVMPSIELNAGLPGIAATASTMTPSLVAFVPPT